MRKAVLAVALMLAACAEPRRYSYPPPVEAPMAPPPRHAAPPPAYEAPTPQPRAVKPLGLGLLTAKTVGGYIDAEERELRVTLHGSGVGVVRPGDAITLVIRDDYLFERGSTDLSSRGAQVIAAIAATMRKYDSTALAVNGYTDGATPPDRAQAVTLERADAVVKALGEAGVDGKRLSARGQGSTHLKIPTSGAEPRNRRIEIVISPLMKG